MLSRINSDISSLAIFR